MNTQIQNSGHEIIASKSHGHPWLVSEFFNGEPRMSIICRSQDEVLSYLEFNWPVGTQIQWKVTP